MKRTLSLLIVCVMCFSLFVSNVSAAEVHFTDVKADAYYYEPVAWALEKGIANGTSPTTFSPDTACTRAHMATFLWRAAGSPKPTGSENPFKDVPAGQYYTEAVQWAYEQGIAGGTSLTTFSPDLPCTRAQMATFLWRNANTPAPKGAENPFKDVPAGQYYTEAVQWAYEQEITGGTSLTTFSPDDSCTRAQMVTFLYRNFGRLSITKVELENDGRISESAFVTNANGDFAAIRAYVYIEGATFDEVTFKWEWSESLNGTFAEVGKSNEGKDIFATGNGDVMFGVKRALLTAPVYVRVTVTDAKGYSVTSEPSMIYCDIHGGYIFADLNTPGDEVTFSLTPHGGNGNNKYEWGIAYNDNPANDKTLASQYSEAFYTGNTTKKLTLDKDLYERFKLGEAEKLYCKITCGDVSCKVYYDIENY